MIKKIILLFLFLCIIPGLVSAATTIDAQKEINKDLEPGNEYSFHLVIKDLTTITTIKATGNGSDWFMFGDNMVKEYAITNLVDQSLLVTVFVPSNTTEGSYETNIKANDDVLSKITINILPPSEDEIEKLKETTDYLRTTLDTVYSNLINIEAEQKHLESKLNDAKNDINKIKSDLVTEINIIAEHQKNVAEMENQFNEEKKELESLINDLELKTQNLTQEKENLISLTGDITLNSSFIGFSIGFIAGVIVIFVFMRKDTKFKAPKLRDKKSKPDEPEKRPRYEFKPRNK